MSYAECDEADDCDKEGEIFYALYGVGKMQRNVDDPRDVAGEQRYRNRSIEQYIDEGTRCADGKGLEQQYDSKGDEKVSQFVSMHGITSFRKE